MYNNHTWQLFLQCFHNQSTSVYFVLFWPSIHSNFQLEQESNALTFSVCSFCTFLNYLTLFTIKCPHIKTLKCLQPPQNHSLKSTSAHLIDLCVFQLLSAFSHYCGFAHFSHFPNFSKFLHLAMVLPIITFSNDIINYWLSLWFSKF